jgi:hypothetical protein
VAERSRSEPAQEECGRVSRASLPLLPPRQTRHATQSLSGHAWVLSSTPRGLAEKSAYPSFLDQSGARRDRVNTCLRMGFAMDSNLPRSLAKFKSMNDRKALAREIAAHIYAPRPSAFSLDLLGGQSLSPGPRPVRTIQQVLVVLSKKPNGHAIWMSTSSPFLLTRDQIAIAVPRVSWK